MRSFIVLFSFNVPKTYCLHNFFTDHSDGHWGARSLYDLRSDIVLSAEYNLTSMYNYEVLPCYIFGRYVKLQHLVQKYFFIDPMLATCRVFFLMIIQAFNGNKIYQRL